MIKSGDLINRMDEGEEGNRRQKPKAREQDSPAEDQADAMAELRARIEQARTVKPSRAVGFHCEDCFRKGRDAAIRVITGEGGQ
jgi:hypothetical protein